MKNRPLQCEQCTRENGFSKTYSGYKALNSHRVQVHGQGIGERSTIITLHIPTRMLENIDKLVETAFLMSRSEFIREAINKHYKDFLEVFKDARDA